MTKGQAIKHLERFNAFDHTLDEWLGLSDVLRIEDMDELQEALREITMDYCEQVMYLLSPKDLETIYSMGLEDEFREAQDKFFEPLGSEVGL